MECGHRPGTLCIIICFAITILHYCIYMAIVYTAIIVLVFGIAYFIFIYDWYMMYILASHSETVFRNFHHVPRESVPVSGFPFTLQHVSY